MKRSKGDIRINTDRLSGVMNRQKILGKIYVQALDKLRLQMEATPSQAKPKQVVALFCMKNELEMPEGKSFRSWLVNRYLDRSFTLLEGKESTLKWIERLERETLEAKAVGLKNFYNMSKGSVEKIDWDSVKEAKAFVYAIQNKRTYDVKIGVSEDVDKRIKTLQTGNADILTELFRIPFPTKMKAFDMERALHKKYFVFRKNGEWFSGNLLRNMEERDILFNPTLMSPARQVFLMRIKEERLKIRMSDKKLQSKVMSEARKFAYKWIVRNEEHPTPKSISGISEKVIVREMSAFCSQKGDVPVRGKVKQWLLEKYLDRDFKRFGLN